MTTAIKINDIDHQRGVASSQVLLHQSKSEPAKPMMMITMNMIIMKLIFHGEQIQLNIQLKPCEVTVGQLLMLRQRCQ